MLEITYPDYDRCLTNISCAILKYFGLPHRHPALDVLDKTLAEKDYKNIVLLIYDGMGMNILSENLSEQSFLRRHLVGHISSVFPTTTAAATTTLRSGLHPAEHGWTGWDVYIQPVDAIITAFYGQKKGEDIPFSTEHVTEKYLGYRSLVQQINEDTAYDAYALFPFGDDAYHGLEDFNGRITDLCRLDGKKFIHAYYNNPDSMLHDYGTKDPAIKHMMQEIDQSTQELVAQLDDTLVICLADHGHLDVEKIVLMRDYPDIAALLSRDDIAGDGRSAVFWVDEKNKPQFEQKFAEYFNCDFLLMPKTQIIETGLFGRGKAHPNFEASIGDYIAIGIGNKYMEFHDDPKTMKSHHAGITKAEMFVPLILFRA